MACFLVQTWHFDYLSWANLYPHLYGHRGFDESFLKVTKVPVTDVFLLSLSSVGSCSDDVWSACCFTCYITHQLYMAQCQCQRQIMWWLSPCFCFFKCKSCRIYNLISLTLPDLQPPGSSEIFKWRQQVINMLSNVQWPGPPTTA